MSRRCPTCGHPRGREVSSADRKALDKLAEEFPGFTCHGAWRGEHQIEDTYYRPPGRPDPLVPLIGNRTVAQVRAMLEAMKAMSA